MAKIEYPEGSLEREYLRDALRRQGTDSVDEVAAAIRERWHHSPLRSYRLALEMSLEKVCDHVNRLLEVFADDPSYFRHATLSRYEYWPATTKSRRPTVSHLLALARVYGTSPRNLVGPSDWGKLSPADRYTIQALDQQAETSATASTGTGSMMEVAGPQASATSSPANSWVAPTMIRPGNSIERITTMTGDETARYGDRASAVGETTLEQLRADLTEQSRRFPTAPRLELFGNLLLLRDRLFHYLDVPGRIGVSQTRDLHFFAGVTCGLLATVTDDLGNPSAALSNIRTAHMFAKEAGVPALTAWLYAQQAVVCYWNGQYATARDHARRGQDIHPVGTVAVFLPAVEARASGELHDAAASRAAVVKATEARGRVQAGDLDTFGGFMFFNEAKQHFYTADSYLGIRDHAAAITEATVAIDAYETGPAEEQAYDNMTIARFHTALAHAWAGDLDAAQHLAQNALEMAPEHRHAQVIKSAQRLYRQLCAHGLKNSPLAVETRDRIEEFLTVTPPRPELS